MRVGISFDSPFSSAHLSDVASSEIKGGHMYWGLLYIESERLRIRISASAETDKFYCLKAPGSTRPQATGFLGLPGSKIYQFLY